MKSKKILISGASITGPTLAYWLNQYSFEVVIVEKSAELRLGGQNIDVKGPAKVVAEKMGIVEEIRALNTTEAGMRFVDASDRMQGCYRGRCRMVCHTDCREGYRPGYGWCLHSGIPGMVYPTSKFSVAVLNQLVCAVGSKPAKWLISLLTGSSKLPKNEIELPDYIKQKASNSVKVL